MTTLAFLICIICCYLIWSFISLIKDIKKRSNLLGLFKIEYLKEPENTEESFNEAFGRDIEAYKAYQSRNLCGLCLTIIIFILAIIIQFK